MRRVVDPFFKHLRTGGWRAAVPYRVASGNLRWISSHWAVRVEGGKMGQNRWTGGCVCGYRFTEKQAKQIGSSWVKTGRLPAACRESCGVSEEAPFRVRTRRKR
jgi:hypothetical protein